VVHVGHLELLKLCQIVYVLPRDKLTKPEFQLKIYYHVVGNVVMDVVEVSHLLLGNIMKILVSLQVIFMEIIPGVNLIAWLLVLIILLVLNTQPVLLANTQLHLVKALVNLIIPNTHSMMINIMDQALTLSLEFQESKLKLWPTDQLKLLSLYMLISQHTKVVFINILQDLN